MKTAIFDKTGKELKKIDLPSDIFGVAWNADLVHDCLVSMQSNSRKNVAHTKDRAEVSGGGKKPWRQKGTGRARHGSIRSPLWRGGGTTFGPRNEKDYSRKINKKVKMKALAVVLSQKARDDEIVLVDSLKMSDIKTNIAQKTIDSISKNKGFEKLKSQKTGLIIALSGKDEKTEKSFRNIGNVSVDQIRNVNIVDILNYKYLVIENPDESFKVLAGRVSSSNSKKEFKNQTAPQKSQATPRSASKPASKPMAKKSPAHKTKK